MDKGQRLVMYALSRGAFGFDEEGYRLKSGGPLSPYFFISKHLNGGGDLEVLTDLYAETIGPDLVSDCDGVIGPPMAGTMLAGPVVMGLYRRYNSSDDFCYYSYRRSPKLHGEKGVITGGSIKGKRLIQIDDTFTLGTSFAESIDVVNQHGGESFVGIVAFDRRERGLDPTKSRGMEFTEKHKMHIISIANVNDLVWCLSQKSLKLDGREEILKRVEDYRQANCYLGA